VNRYVDAAVTGGRYWRTVEITNTPKNKHFMNKKLLPGEVSEQGKPLYEKSAEVVSVTENEPASARMPDSRRSHKITKD
jgi:hypothetical protein